MRISSLIPTFAAFGVAALGSYLASGAMVAVVEETSVDAIEEQLASAGYDWAEVLGDGLQIVLEGEAPTEALRFRTIAVAGGVVDASRVIDNMSVAASAVIAPPDFALEILRNDGGVSVIGLLPASVDREDFIARIARATGGQQVADLLEVADYAVPAEWRTAQDFAIEALEQLPRSKISVSPGEVGVIAIAESPDARTRLERELTAAAPAALDLGLTISAPRPVITPFTTRFLADENGPRFDACVASNAEELAQITAAARAAGVTGALDCIEALGAPSRRWGEAVALGIDAVSRLGGGTITYSDAEVLLVGVEGTPAALFDDVAGELANALPDAFAFDAELPQPPDQGEAGPPRFTATLSPEGSVQLRGRVSDALLNETVENFAHAEFGTEVVTMGTIVAEGMPSGWSVRLLTAVEALSYLSNGAVVVTPTEINVNGNTGNQDARAAISRLIIERLGQDSDFEIAVTYVEALDPVAGLPTPEECIANIMALTAERKITFDPGSATLSSSSIGLVDDIAETLRRCAELRLEIAGYTDSQGRDSMNLSLSQERANAVLAALRQRRVPVGNFVATGYGEADPIADNGTEDGREANRRIEFRLIVPEPTEEVLTGLEALEDDGSLLVEGAEPPGRPVSREEATGSDIGPELPEPESDSEDEAETPGDESGDGDAE